MNSKLPNIILVLIILIIPQETILAQDDFSNYFTDGCIRLDLVLAGNSEESYIFLDEICKEPYWGGPHRNLIDPFDYGEYRILVQDDSSSVMIYSRGFCTYFAEWQTVAEAKIRNKAFDQVIRFPTPLKSVTVRIQERDEENIFQPKFSVKIDPDDPYIHQGLKTGLPQRRIHGDGNPESSLDIVFVAEGYTSADSNKFYLDAERFAGYLIDAEPFNKQKRKINIYAVAALSKDAGTDLPGEGIWKKTAIGSSFYTFGLDRYLMTEDYKAVCDAAANVPYDQICILVNSDRYGGGGIYNHYCIVTSDNSYSEKVLVHEFGHSFAGLADEYYTSDVAYEDFFRLDLEPWQPNLTTLVDFDSKWKHMLRKNTPVPTPSTTEYQKLTGVFEGGGYSAKGIFRPALNCRMKSNSAQQFCEVCQDAIIRMISYYTE